ncbi:MAG: GNAT family N-acetyltransferase [Candidatus Magasanikbacteria bacterium]|nr:GNAT family N-acetyltransferase [Candidatus Magasanikbacteria bacterium]
MRGLKAEVAESAGPVGLELLNDYLAGRIDADRVEETLEEMMDFQDFQKLGIEYLTQLGIVEKRNGDLIVDLEKIKSMTQYVIPFHKRYGLENEKRKTANQGRSSGVSVSTKDYNDAVERFKDYHVYFQKSQKQARGALQGDLASFLFNTFHDQPVVSKHEQDEWEQSGRQGKPPEAKSLFYSPESAAAAFDVKKIKQADFHLGIWKVRGEGAEDYSPFHPNLPLDEAAFACLIYSPQHGNGQRDKNGRLLVNFPDGTKRRPITQKWINDVISKGHKRRIESGEFYASPATALREGKMPHLYNPAEPKQALLNPDDFRVLATVERSSRHGLRREITNNKGMVMLNERVRYTLGSDVASVGNKKHFVVQISPNLGGITEEVEISGAKSEKLIKIFDLLRPGDPRLKKYRTSTTEVFRALIGDINIRDFTETAEEILTRRPNETDTEFKTRSEAYDFSDTLRLKREVVRETGASLEGLSAKEQQAFLAYYRSIDASRQKDFYQFIRVHGARGLKTFLAAEYDESAGEKILGLAKKLPAAETGIIFEKFNSFVVLAEKVEEELNNFFVDSSATKDVSRLKVTEELLKRAGRILVDYSASEKNASNTTLKDLVIKLDGIKENLQMFVSIFKTAYKGKEKIDFSEVRGLDLQSSDSSQLSQEDIASMRQIFHDNRAELSPEFAAFRVKEEFDPVLKEPGHKFYALKRNGQIISFARFDELPNGNLYTGFVNTRPEIKGMTIGSAFFEAALAREAADKAVELKVRTENPAQKLYTRLGFKVVDRYVDSKSGKEYVKMLRPAVAARKAEGQSSEELRKAA